MIDYNLQSNKLTVEQEQLIRSLSKAADPEELKSFKNLTSTAITQLIDAIYQVNDNGTMCFTSCGSALTQFSIDGRESKRRNLDQGGRHSDRYEDYVLITNSTVRGKFIITDGKLQGEVIEINPSERLEDLVFSSVVSYYSKNYDKFWNYDEKELEPLTMNIPLLEFYFFPNFKEGFVTIRVVTITVTSESITCSSKTIDESRLKRAEIEYGMEVQCNDQVLEIEDILEEYDFEDR